MNYFGVCMIQKVLLRVVASASVFFLTSCTGLNKHLEACEKYRSYSCKELYETYIPIRKKHIEQLKLEKQGVLTEQKGQLDRVLANFTPVAGQERHTEFNALISIAKEKECFYHGYDIPEWDPKTNKLFF